jgi:hypothetical protein
MPLAFEAPKPRRGAMFIAWQTGIISFLFFSGAAGGTRLEVQKLQPANPLRSVMPSSRAAEKQEILFAGGYYKHGTPTGFDPVPPLPGCAAPRRSRSLRPLASLTGSNAENLAALDRNVRAPPAMVERFRL